jgi:hypothetical protein
MKIIYLVSLLATLLSSCTCVPSRPPLDDSAQENFREIHAHRFDRER